MRPMDLVLERAGDARKAGEGWLVSCPLPGHGKDRGDRDPSVSVTEGDDGRALVNCLAGCETERIVPAWGLTMANLFEEAGRGVAYLSGNGATAQRPLDKPLTDAGKGVADADATADNAATPPATRPGGYLSL